MGTLRNQNKSFRMLILIIAVVLVAWSVWQDRKANTKLGELEYKMVTGVKDGSFQVIMLETSDRFFVLDSTFRSIFDNNDAEAITRPEQLQLLSAYKDLQYRVGFHQFVTEKQAQFRVNRDIFNQLEFNKNIKFEINKKVLDSLNQILAE